MTRNQPTNSFLRQLFCYLLVIKPDCNCTKGFKETELLQFTQKIYFFTTNYKTRIATSQKSIIRIFILLKDLFEKTFLKIFRQNIKFIDLKSTNEIRLKNISHNMCFNLCQDDYLLPYFSSTDVIHKDRKSLLRETSYG